MMSVPSCSLLRLLASHSLPAGSSCSSPHLRLPSRPDSPSHHWSPPLPSSTPAARCTLCRTVLAPPAATAAAPPGATSGRAALVCTDCGLVSHRSWMKLRGSHHFSNPSLYQVSCDLSRCLKAAEKRHRCKAIAFTSSSRRRSSSLKQDQEEERAAAELKHHWVPAQGHKECEVCDGEQVSGSCHVVRLSPVVVLAAPLTVTGGAGCVGGRCPCVQGGGGGVHLLLVPQVNRGIGRCRWRRHSFAVVACAGPRTAVARSGSESSATWASSVASSFPPAASRPWTRRKRRRAAAIRGDRREYGCRPRSGSTRGTGGGGGPHYLRY